MKMSFARAGYESERVPSDVRFYLKDFQKCLKSNDATRIYKCQHDKWRIITDKYYKMNPWPTAEAVVASMGRAMLKDEDGRTFVILYKELRFRHIFTRVPDQRDVNIVLESFQNYIDLFNLFLEQDTLIYNLPNLWLWEMINTFVGIFEWYQDWKSTPWNMQSVLRYLHALVDKAGIPLKYNQETGADQVDDRVRFLGYCSIIGLLRVHSITADYISALEVLNSVDLYKRSALTAITSCHVSAFYYMGVAYFMMKRYKDAFQCFKPIYEYYSSQLFELESPPTRDEFNSYHSLLDRIYTYIFMLSKIDTKLYDQLDAETRERIEEKDFTYQIEQITATSSTHHDQQEAWNTLFKRDCPTYITPHPFDLNGPKVDDQIKSGILGQPRMAQAAGFATDAAYRQQRDIFLRNIRDRDFVRRLRGELRLYKTIPVRKLAARVEESQSRLSGKKDFNMQLLRLKLGSRQLKRTQGVMASGDWFTDPDADFFIEKGIVTINEKPQTNRRREQYFLRQIRTMQEHVASDVLA